MSKFAPRALSFVILIGVLLGCGHRASSERREVILFSVVGVRPFSDSVSTISLDGSRPKQPLPPKQAASYMYASGYTTEGPLLVVVHQMIKNNRTEDRLFAYRPLDFLWQPIETPPGSVGRGAFSPDSSRIVFAFAPGDGAFYKLYVKSLETREVRRLSTSEEEPYEREAYASWRPDGKEVVFLALRVSSGHLVTKLLRVAVPGGEPQLVLGPDDSPGGAAYSPDGRMLCVFSGKGIEELKLDTQGRRVILDWKLLPYHGYRFGCIGWSRTSNLIAFSIFSSVTKKWEIWTVSLNGENPRRIYTVPEGTVEGVFFLAS